MVEFIKTNITNIMDMFSIYSGWGVWFLQFAVGVIFIYHGWPKLKTIGNFKKFFSIGGGLHGLVEVVGGVALIFGWHIRSVGLVFAVIMLGAIYFKKFKWRIPFSSQSSTGWEFDLILLAASLYFLVH